MVFYGQTRGFGFIKMHSRFVSCHSFGSQKFNYGTWLKARRRVLSVGFHFTNNTDITSYTATFRHLRWKNRWRRHCSSLPRISAAIYWQIIHLEALFSFDRRTQDFLFENLHQEEILGKCRRRFTIRFPGVAVSSRWSTSENWGRAFRAPTLTCGKLCIRKNVRPLCSHCFWVQFAIKRTPCTGWKTVIIHETTYAFYDGPSVGDRICHEVRQ